MVFIEHFVVSEFACRFCISCACSSPQDFVFLLVQNTLAKGIVPTVKLTSQFTLLLKSEKRYVILVYY